MSVESPPDLQRSLSQLHRQLSALENVPENERAQLQAVLADVERLLSTRQSGDAEHPVSRSEALAVQLEARHPLVAGGLRELVELLRQTGL